MRRCITSFAILLALIAFSPTQTMAKGPGGGSQGGGQSRNHSGGSFSAGSQSSGIHVGGGQQRGDLRFGVGGGSGINLGVRSNTGSSGNQGFGNQGMKPHQVFDPHSRPEVSGGRGEGHNSGRYRWDNGRWWFRGPDNRWMWYGDDGRWQYYGNAYVVQRPIVENFSGGPIKIVNPPTNGVTLNYVLNGHAFTIPPGYSQNLREDRAWVIQFSRGTTLDQARYGLQSGVYTFTRTDHGWELYRREFPQVAAPPNPSPQ